MNLCVSKLMPYARSPLQALDKMIEVRHLTINF